MVKSHIGVDLMLMSDIKCFNQKVLSYVSTLLLGIPQIEIDSENIRDLFGNGNPLRLVIRNRIISLL